MTELFINITQGSDPERCLEYIYKVGINETLFPLNYLIKYLK